MKTLLSLTLAIALIGVAAAPVARAEEPKDKAELAKAVRDAKVSLQKGLGASAKEGKPISAKYEMHEGHLQLSVYTAKADKFSEVVVDHKSGKVAKAEPITQAEDLSAAKEQSAAMGKASVSLQKAVGKAVYANKGYKAVSVYPSVKDGEPVAEVTLVKGDDWKTVTEKLK